MIWAIENNGKHYCIKIMMWMGVEDMLVRDSEMDA